MSETRRRILFVDDDEDLRMLFTKRLELAGYEITQAQSGEEAIAMVQANAPDLVILDVELPNMNGYDVCAKLKKGRATRAIPIVMFTAKGNPAEQIDGVRAGADAYISKLCPIEDLLARIHGLLGMPADTRNLPKRNG